MEFVVRRHESDLLQLLPAPHRSEHCVVHLAALLAIQARAEQQLVQHRFVRGVLRAVFAPQNLTATPRAKVRESHAKLVEEPHSAAHALLHHPVVVKHDGHQQVQAHKNQRTREAQEPQNRGNRRDLIHVSDVNEAEDDLQRRAERLERGGPNFEVHAPDHEAGKGKVQEDREKQNHEMQQVFTRLGEHLPQLGEFGVAAEDLEELEGDQNDIPEKVEAVPIDPIHQ
mmetsp:Transcript_125268/g.359808  ORF Transcript_125268/g.359808 Transcript_125268/m.359808 type:complete len:227 (-) Transcript_125268:1693-2373(-)